jgi:hypothetical protein
VCINSQFKSYTHSHIISQPHLTCSSSSSSSSIYCSSTWGNSIHLLATQYNFASEYSQNLELCNLEDYLGLLWSYFLCTRHTVGTDKLTVCICELLNSLVRCFLLSPVHTCSFSIPSFLFYTSPVSNLWPSTMPPQKNINTWHSTKRAKTD